MFVCVCVCAERAQQHVLRNQFFVASLCGRLVLFRWPKTKANKFNIFGRMENAPKPKAKMKTKQKQKKLCTHRQRTLYRSIL